MFCSTTHLSGNVVIKVLTRSVSRACAGRDLSAGPLNISGLHHDDLLITCGKLRLCPSCLHTSVAERVTCLHRCRKTWWDVWLFVSKDFTMGAVDQLSQIFETWSKPLARSATNKLPATKSSATLETDLSFGLLSRMTFDAKMFGAYVSDRIKHTALVSRG